MQILQFRRHDAPKSERGFRVVARFAVEIVPGFSVQDWQLVETPDGNHLAYPPAGANRRPTVNIDREIRRDVIDMAKRALELMNDRRAA